MVKNMFCTNGAAEDSNSELYGVGFSINLRISVVSFTSTLNTDLFLKFFAIWSSASVSKLQRMG